MTTASTTGPLTILKAEGADNVKTFHTNTGAGYDHANLDNINAAFHATTGHDHTGVGTKGTKLAADQSLSAGGTLVGTTAIQTLTQKTLQYPAVTANLNLTAGQIVFPATQVPSADANTLDDYEEGTWAPTLNSFTIVGADQSAARYTKIGRQVLLEIDLKAATTIACTAGTSNITNLPFAPGVGGTCTAANGDGVGYGVGALITASAIYPPAWSAYAGHVYITCVYSV